MTSATIIQPSLAIEIFFLGNCKTIMMTGKLQQLHDVWEGQKQIFFFFFFLGKTGSNLYEEGLEFPNILLLMLAFYFPKQEFVTKD